MKKLVLLALMLGAQFCFGQKATSFYSSTNAKVVAVLSSSELEKEPEIDHFEHLCPGYGGYELLHRGGDTRSWIEVRFQGKTSDLYLESMEASGGTFPSKANDIVEWRGVLKDKVFTPYAVIYRMQAQDPNQDGRSFTKLLVVALNKGASKVLGATSGKNADVEAKRLADTVKPR
ncbi:MAG: hypothetical protein ACON38_15320 [Akkermansiaceae bacterium]